MQPDSRRHRHHQCHATSSVWEQYPSLCSELEELDDIHVNLPVVFHPPQLDFLQYCFHQDNPPEIIPEVQQVIMQQSENGIVPTFYSDGSCLNPDLPVASLAAWGLILSLDTNEVDKERAVKTCTSIGAVTQHFLVVATARCHGTQSIDRAELQAMVFLHERFRKTKLVTDSQYTIDCWKRVNETTDANALIFQANSDLLCRLFHANRDAQHEVSKVKSHTWEFGNSGDWPCYDTLGNEVADQVAKSANNTLHPVLIQEWKKFQHELRQDIDRRKKHYEMLGELHRCQTILSGQRELTVQGDQIFMGHLGKSVYEVMAAYTPSDFFHKDIFWESDVGLEMPWTSEILAAILQFWNDVQWSSPTEDEIGKQGISWTELTISFLMDRKISIPTKIPHTKHWAMSLVDVKAGGWGFFHVSKCFFYMCQTINKAVKGRMFEGLHRGQVRSMQKLGGTNHVRGFLFRPGIPQQQRVVKVLETYFKEHGRCGGLHVWPVVGNSGHEDDAFWSGLQTADS